MPKFSVSAYVLVGVSSSGFRYWVFMSDVEAAEAKKLLERANYAPKEDYTIRMANVMQYRD